MGPSGAELLSKAGRILEREPRLIELPGSGRAVFVGDTHGDFEATRTVIDRYMREATRIVFLGDYVDRGEKSQENIDFLLKLKLQKPDRIILLMGNHECNRVMPFHPSDFWEGLSERDRDLYGATLMKLPLAVSAKGLIALHGALPDLKRMEDINGIRPGIRDKEWLNIIWGDFAEGKGHRLREFLGRPRFGRDYFEQVMKRFRKSVLIRSHDPEAKTIMFGKRCLTLFTSHAYMERRTVGIVELGKEVKTTDDIEIEEI